MLSTRSLNEERREGEGSGGEGRGGRERNPFTIHDDTFTLNKGKAPEASNCKSIGLQLLESRSPKCLYPENIIHGQVGLIGSPLPATVSFSAHSW